MEYYLAFRQAILDSGANTHVLLSRPPLHLHSARELQMCTFVIPVQSISDARLAYLRHAASVHPELGSNS